MQIYKRKVELSDKRLLIDMTWEEMKGLKLTIGKIQNLKFIINKTAGGLFSKYCFAPISDGDRSNHAENNS